MKPRSGSQSLLTSSPTKVTDANRLTRLGGKIDWPQAVPRGKTTSQTQLMKASKLFPILTVVALGAFSVGAATLFPVVVDGRWGFISKAGKLVTNPQFTHAEAFAEDRAAVELNHRWGYVDEAGKVGINPQFDKAGPFSEGLAAVQLGHIFGYVNTDGKYV